MSNPHELEKGDTIATKDGRSLRVLSVYKNGNEVLRLEAVDDSSESPKRLPLLPGDVIRILRKAQKAEAEKVVI